MHNDHLTHPVLRPLIQRLLPRVARVVFVSDHLRRRAVEAFPEHAQRLATVCNGTDAARFRPVAAPRACRGAFTFLFAGRLVPEKGVQVLLEAFARVLEVRPGVRLLLVGSSFFDEAPRTAHERALRAQAAGLGDAVTFTGFLPHEALARCYAEADAVVVPSVWAEPSGLVVLEAMACGTCVIASRTGGIPELIEHGHNGLLVPPGDVAALAAAMLRTLDEAGTRTRLGRQARQAVLARHTWDHVADAVAAELARAADDAQLR
jgi:spore coat protein SA